MATVYIWGGNESPIHTSVTFLNHNNEIEYISYTYKENKLVNHSFYDDNYRFNSNKICIEIKGIDKDIYKSAYTTKEDWKDFLTFKDGKLKEHLKHLFSCNSFVASVLLEAYEKKGLEEWFFVYFKDFKHKNKFYKGSLYEFIISSVNFYYKGKFLRTIAENKAYSTEEKLAYSFQALFISFRSFHLRFGNLKKIYDKAQKDGVSVENLLYSITHDIGIEKIGEDLISEYFDMLHNALWTPKEVLSIAREMSDRDAAKEQKKTSTKKKDKPEDKRKIFGSGDSWDNFLDRDHEAMVYCICFLIALSLYVSYVIYFGHDIINSITIANSVLSILFVAAFAFTLLVIYKVILYLVCVVLPGLLLLSLMVGFILLLTGVYASFDSSKANTQSKLQPPNDIQTKPPDPPTNKGHYPKGKTPPVPR